jgi:DNA-binding response OmpR family regulator
MSIKRILIVEDDRDQQRGLATWLRAHGYEAIFASDGIQAISAARKERPDLILLDIGLPGGDGHSVIDRLKAMSPSASVPIIALSAKDPASHEESMMEAGAEADFQKPADSEELLAAIRQALGEEPIADAAA